MPTVNPNIPFAPTALNHIAASMFEEKQQQAKAEQERQKQILELKGDAAKREVETFKELWFELPGNLQAELAENIKSDFKRAKFLDENGFPVDFMIPSNPTEDELAARRAFEDAKSAVLVHSPESPSLTMRRSPIDALNQPGPLPAAAITDRVTGGGFGGGAAGGGQGGAGGGPRLSVAELNDLRGDLRDLEKTSVSIRNLMAKMRKRDFGITGALQRMANTVFGKVGIDFAERSVDLKESAEALKIVYRNTFQVDGQVNRAEMKQIDELIDQFALSGSERKARTSLNALAESVEERLRHTAGELGRKPIIDMDLRELNQAHKDGLITKQKRSWAVKAYPRLRAEAQLMGVDVEELLD